MKKIIFALSTIIGLAACGTATEDGTENTGSNNSGITLNFLNGDYTLSAKSTTTKGNNGVICTDATGTVTFVTDESGTFLQSTMTGSVTDSNGVVYSLIGSAVPATPNMKGSFNSSNSNTGEFTILLASFNTSVGEREVGVFSDNFGCRGTLHLSAADATSGNTNTPAQFNGSYTFTAQAAVGTNASDCATGASGTLTVNNLQVAGSAIDSDTLSYSLGGTINASSGLLAGTFIASDGSSIGTFNGDFQKILDTLSVGAYIDIFDCEGRWLLAKK